MTNKNAKLTTDTPVLVKLVEITGQKPLSAQNEGGEQMILGRGEGAIYKSRAAKAGVSLTREIKPCQLVENLFTGKTGMVALDPESKAAEAATHIAFVPVMHGLDEDKRGYDMALHLDSIKEVLKQACEIELSKGVKAKPADITLRMTAPGTYEGREKAESRKEQLAAKLSNMGVSVQWLMAWADLPADERRGTSTESVKYEGFKFTEGDLMVNGSRQLRSKRVTEAMRTVGQLLLQGQGAKRLVVPLTIGANLALAEAAQAAGVQVVLAYIGSDPQTWVEDNRERVNALTAGGATVIGDINREWERGLFSASIEQLASMALAARAGVALLTPPSDGKGEGNRLAEHPAVKNFFPQVQAYLDSKLGAGAVEAELNAQQEKREAGEVAEANKQARQSQLEEAGLAF